MPMYKIYYDYNDGDGVQHLTEECYSQEEMLRSVEWLKADPYCYNIIPVDCINM